MKNNFINFRTFIIIILFFVSIYTFGNQEYLKIHFINVGEGDSIYIEFPNKKNVLIDTGNIITGVDVYNYLKKNGVNKIDHLIITHPHPDHFSGIFTITQLFKVKNFYDNNQEITEEIEENDYYRWYNDFIRKDNRYKKLKAGDKLKFNRAQLEILWPDELFYEDWNTNSLVIMIKYGDFKILLMGDANYITELELIKRKIDIHANILKAGHHGADDTGLEEFRKNVQPEVVIISINKNNYRGYPSPDVVNNFIQNGSKVYTTYKNGTIIFKVNENGKYTVNFRRF